MDIFSIMNVVTMQRRRYCAIILMDVFGNLNALMVQLINENEEISKLV